MNDEIITLVKWALPPIAAATGTALMLLWKRLIVVEDRYVDLLKDYNCVLRDLSGSLQRLSGSSRTTPDSSASGSRTDLGI